MEDGVVLGGLGIVGTATRKLFHIHDYFDLKGATLSLQDIAEKKRYIFMCLPTPATEDGYKWQPIYELIKQIEGLGGGQKVYIVRSTLIPGTVRHMNELLNIKSIVHNPEFLTMRTINRDTTHPDIVVIGALKDNYAQDVKALYQEVMEKQPDYFITDPNTSEMAKLAINNFYALKVIFANQMYDVAKMTDSDYDMVRVIMYARKWVGKNHLEVWQDDKRGYAGMCLPKDVKAMVGRFHPPLMELVDSLNEFYLRQTL